jgi:hypothetical protein
VAAPKDKSAEDPTDKNSLIQWRQGDFSRDCQSFVYVDYPDDDGSGLSFEAFEEQAEEIKGLVVVSQTCDIVREPEDRPYVEVCPLVQVDERQLQEAIRGTSPQFAIVPSVSDQGFVADLDRVMTIGKTLLATWAHEQGCSTDEQRAKFAQSLERKRGRFAFPNEFTLALSGFRRRIYEKYRKDGVVGQTLRSLFEIRVRGAPDWDSEQIEIMFLFIMKDSANRKDVAGLAEDLVSKVTLPPNYTYSEPEFIAGYLSDITARDYLESFHLDYEHLSLPL